MPQNMVMREDPAVRFPNPVGEPDQGRAFLVSKAK